MGEVTTFIGLDVHKATVSVGVAEAGRAGEVRFLGEIPNRPAAVARFVQKLAQRHPGQLSFCYEAGPCGYALYRQLRQAGHDCVVVAPSLVPTRPGERVKTDRRDALTLARLHRTGELVAVWVPDPAHEAMRDLVRARLDTVAQVRKARQQLQGFLLRQGRVYAGRGAWTAAHRRWLATVRFSHAAHQVILQEYIDAIADAEQRRDRLTAQIERLLPEWSLAPVVAALQAMRGVAFVTAVTLAAEVGDFGRFGNPRQLMAYFGLVPSEHSSGPKARHGAITKAGSQHARHVLIEGAWTYRLSPRVSPKLQARLEGLPKAVREVAWKAQLRLCSRYRAMIARGKPWNVVTTAIAREMVGFIWAIARQVTPAA
jgi:transposase